VVELDSSATGFGTRSCDILDVTSAELIATRGLVPLPGQRLVSFLVSFMYVYLGPSPSNAAL
jgi:hypothetical protein